MPDYPQCKKAGKLVFDIKLASWKLTPQEAGKLEAYSTNGQAGSLPHLLADAEAAKDFAENILGVNFADHGGEVVERHSQFGCN